MDKLFKKAKVKQENGKFIVEGSSSFYPLLHRFISPEDIILKHPDIILISSTLSEDLKINLLAEGKRFIQVIRPTSLKQYYRHLWRYNKLTQTLKEIDQKVPIILDEKNFLQNIERRYHAQLLKDFSERKIITLDAFKRQNKKKQIYRELANVFPRGVRDIPYAYLTGGKDIFVRKWTLVTEELKDINPLFGPYFDSIASFGNYVYITEYSSRSVFVLENLPEETRLVRRWRYADPNMYMSRLSIGITISASGEVYINTSSLIKVFTLTGELLREWNPNIYSEGIAVLSEENKERVYLISRSVFTYTSEGVPINNWHADITARHIAISSDKKIYLAAQSAVAVYYPEGKALRGRPEVLKGHLIKRWPALSSERKMKIESLTVSPDNLVFICDYQISGVHVFTSEGTLIREFGEPGTRDGEFKNIRGLTVLPTGEIYVIDGTNRVQVFRTV